MKVSYYSIYVYKHNYGTFTQIFSLKLHNIFVDDEDDQNDSSFDVQTDFQDGELVWGPHGNFPSWPGKLIRSDRSKKVLVCWFGNKDTTQVDTESLKSLSDGLEAHHRERKKLRK